MSKYPKHLDGLVVWVGSTKCTVREVSRAVLGRNIAGFFDPEKCTICIYQRMTLMEKIKTLCHELIHAGEFEYNRHDMPHEILRWVSETVVAPMMCHEKNEELVNLLRKKASES